MLRIVLHTRGRWKFSLADIKKIFCRSDLWSKSSHVLVVAAWNVFPIHSLLYSELDIKSESKIHVPTTWCITISSMATFQRKSPYIPKLNLPSLAGLLHSGISNKLKELINILSPYVIPKHCWYIEPRNREKSLN